MFYDKRMETMPRGELETIQLFKLKNAAVKCYENVKMYKDKFDKAGFNPYKIDSLSDLKNMPFTTKEDFRLNYPFGLLAVPKKQVVRIHASSGTTGKPTVVAYTKNDLDMWSDCMARIIAAAGTTPDDTVQISFGYGLFTGALGLHYGLEKLGAMVIPISAGNTERQIIMMKDLEVTALVATPSYAMHIGDCAKEMGYDIKKDFKLRLGLLGSEGCTEEMRQQLENSLGIFVTDNYGMSELIGPGISGECEHRRGLHFCEDHFLPEIIDPNNLEVLPAGEKGELVITTLSKEALPVMRYRTKDITRLNYDMCECGRTSVRMEKTTGRTDDMLKIRGVNIFPSQIESVVMTIPEVAPHYELVISRDGSHDALEVKLELMDGSLLDSFANLENLRKKIQNSLITVLGINTKISLVEPKSLARYEGKAKRIVDNRNI